MAAVPQNVLKVVGVTQKSGCELYLAIMLPILFNFEVYFESTVPVQSEPKEQTCVCMLLLIQELCIFISML